MRGASLLFGPEGFLINTARGDVVDEAALPRSAIVTNCRKLRHPAVQRVVSEQKRSQL